VTGGGATEPLSPIEELRRHLTALRDNNRDGAAFSRQRGNAGSAKDFDDWADKYDRWLSAIGGLR
jgi:hypothetical protein